MLQNYKLPQKHRIVTWVKNSYWGFEQEWFWYRNMYIITRLVWFLLKNSETISQKCWTVSKLQRIYIQKSEMSDCIVKIFFLHMHPLSVFFYKKNWISQVWWMTIFWSCNLAAYEQHTKLPAGKLNLYSNKICFMRHK